MRVIQLELPNESVPTAKEVLWAEDVDHIHTDATDSDGHTVLEFPVPRQAVEPVLNKLREADVPVDDGYRVTLHADVAQTPNLPNLVSRFVKGNEESDYIAREELVARAEGMDPNSFTYYVMTLVGVIVATSGLLMNSPAVVVGSMVVAPQLGAALTSSVGIVVSDREMIVRGLGSQILGLSLGLVGSVIFGLFLRWTKFVTPVLDLGAISEIGGRVSPGVLSVIVAVAAGTAAVMSLASHETPSGALVGVMVSAALIPAAATAGLGVAWGLPRVALGATALLMINVVIINLTGPVVLWLIGYRPDDWVETPIQWCGSARDTVRTLPNYASSVVAVGILVIAAMGGGVAFSQQITYEQAVKSSVDTVLDDPKYDDVELTAVSVEKDYLTANGRANKVQLEINTEGEEYPDLDKALQRAIFRDTGYSTDVVVERATTTQETSKQSDQQSNSESASKSKADVDAAASLQSSIDVASDDMPDVHAGSVSIQTHVGPAGS
jgi:uncharacterized hydrophobic protein (TIGR00341 family)